MYNKSFGGHLRQTSRPVSMAPLGATCLASLYILYFRAHQSSWPSSHLEKAAPMFYILLKSGWEPEVRRPLSGY